MSKNASIINFSLLTDNFSQNQLYRIHLSLSELLLISTLMEYGDAKEIDIQDLAKKNAKDPEKIIPLLQKLIKKELIQGDFEGLQTEGLEK